MTLEEALRDPIHLLSILEALYLKHSTSSYFVDTFPQFS